MGREKPKIMKPNCQHGELSLRKGMLLRKHFSLFALSVIIRKWYFFPLCTWGAVCLRNQLLTNYNGSTGNPIEPPRLPTEIKCMTCNQWFNFLFCYMRYQLNVYMWLINYLFHFFLSYYPTRIKMAAHCSMQYSYYNKPMHDHAFLEHQLLQIQHCQPIFNHFWLY